ncbi:hypothetical protein V7101_20910, partial [Bacillus velezensis]|uniref:hypothetical protein n=1 Tax=Bacillus velezensis TaxID=492670 RepID=UPI003000E4BC
NSKDEELQNWILEDGSESIDVFNEGLAAGTYYLKLYVEDGYVDAATNNYGLRILQATSDFVEKESNDDPATATWMTLGRYYTGFTDADADDIYKIKTTANGKLTIRGTYSQNVEMNYILVDSNFEAIEDWTLEADPEDDGSVYNLFTVGVKAGTYYLVVTHDYEYDEYYNEEYMAQAIFTADNFAEQENNETNITATPIQLKRTFNGMMSMEADVDTYKVYLPCTANITLSMSQARGTAFKATIYNSSNNPVKTLYTTKGTSSLVSLGNVSLAKGTYYVKVEYYSGSSDQVPYKLHLQPKVIWGKIEYRYGMSGKTVALTTAKVYKIVNGRYTYVKSVAKGSESAVYGTDKYGYRLGNGLYMKKDSTVRYDLVPAWVKNNYYLLNR